MSLLLKNEARIQADYLQLAVTSMDRALFLKIARYLGDMPATTTYMVSVMLREPCKVARKLLRRMEKGGYVVSASNGSNCVCWRLKP